MRAAAFGLDGQNAGFRQIKFCYFSVVIAASETFRRDFSGKNFGRYFTVFKHCSQARSGGFPGSGDSEISTDVFQRGFRNQGESGSADKDWRGGAFPQFRNQRGGIVQIKYRIKAVDIVDVANA